MENRKNLAIVGCSSYHADLVRKQLNVLLDAIQGLDFLRPGMKIGIKTNLVSGAAPEKAVTSHPTVLAALTAVLLEHGAGEVIVGDSPGGPFQEGYVNRVYRVSQMEKVEAAGGRLNQNFQSTSISFPAGKICKQLTYTSWLSEVDAVISVCKLKTHGMMMMSANVKNLFGIIPGTMKPEYHYRFPRHEDFADMLIDLNEFLKPVLYITDAIEAMEGNGPTAGTPKFVGALLASQDPYHLDQVCAHLMHLSPEQVPTIAAAVKRGLCPENFDRSRIVGDPDAYVTADFQNIIQKKKINFMDNFPAFLLPAATAILESHPVPDKKECIGCQKCSQICPAHAIIMKNKKPVIDRKKCIRCFCCQEFCPVGAMKVHRSPIARLLQHNPMDERL